MRHPAQSQINIATETKQMYEREARFLILKAKILVNSSVYRSGTREMVGIRHFWWGECKTLGKAKQNRENGNAILMTFSPYGTPPDRKFPCSFNKLTNFILR